ncbi:MAG: CIA30 family protein [Spirochaetaceae bacterium]|jgi:hypothetical protein|nr:CIA30 family protein [Spirochaetaceae bacterium]
MNVKKTLLKAALPVLCVMFLLVAAADGVPGSWTWGYFTDAANQGSSRGTLLEDYETIDGKITTVYKISGEVTNKYQYGYVGWYAHPDDPTRELLKKTKSFSFKILGDGNAYDVMFCTSDITDSAFYKTRFNTKKDQVSTITVRVGSLAQPTDWGIKKKFDQNSATQIQWQTTNNGKPGTFKVKIYDLQLFM